MGARIFRGISSPCLPDDLTSLAKFLSFLKSEAYISSVNISQVTERCPKKRRNKAGGEREAERGAQKKELKCCWERDWGSTYGIR